MHLFMLNLGLWLVLVTSVAAQYWAGTPSCAVQCLDAAARSAGCNKGDIQCMCKKHSSDTSTADDASLKSCVGTYCPQSDAENVLDVVDNFQQMCAEQTGTSTAASETASSTASETTDSSDSSTSEASTTTTTSSKKGTAAAKATVVATEVHPTDQPAAFTNIPIADAHKKPPPPAGPSGGTIAGIVIAILGSIGVVFGIAFWYFRRRQNRKINGGQGGEGRSGGAGGFRWPRPKGWTAAAGRNRPSRPQHFRKLSNNSSKYFDSPSGSPEPDDFPEMMKGKHSAFETVLPLGNRTSVESTRPLSTVTYVAPRKPIPIKGILRAMPPVDERREWDDNRVLTAPTIHRSLGSSNSVRKQGHVDIASVNRAFDTTYAAPVPAQSPSPAPVDVLSTSPQSRVMSSSTVSDMSLFGGPGSPSTPAHETHLRPMPNVRDRESAATYGNEVSRFSMESEATRMSGILPIRKMRNSTMSISERLSAQQGSPSHPVSQLSIPLSASELSRGSKMQSGVSLNSEDGFRTELARMTLGYMPFPPAMPESPAPMPNRFLDTDYAQEHMSHGGQASSLPTVGRKSVSASVGHKSITPSVAAEEDRRAAARERAEGRASVPGVPSESVFSDDGVATPRSALFRETIGSPVLKMASVSEAKASRARLVTVNVGKSKRERGDDGSSTRSGSSEEGMPPMTPMDD